MNLNFAKLAQYMALLEKLAPVIGKVLDRLGIGDNIQPVVPVPEPLTPIPPVVATPPPTPTTQPVIPNPKPRALRNVRIQVQKAERPARVGGSPGDLYPNPMKMVQEGEAFNYEAILWIDATAYDQDGNEFHGDALIASGLAFRARHQFTRQDGATSHIAAEGWDGKTFTPEGDPSPTNWNQDTDGGVKFGQRSWLDSVGMNPRCVFYGEGEYDVFVVLNGVESNHLHIRVS